MRPTYSFLIAALMGFFSPISADATVDYPADFYLSAEVINVDSPSEIVPYTAFTVKVTVRDTPAEQKPVLQHIKVEGQTIWLLYTAPHDMFPDYGIPFPRPESAIESSIPGLPPGQYTLKARIGSGSYRPAIERSLTVTPSVAIPINTMLFTDVGPYLDNTVEKFFMSASVSEVDQLLSLNISLRRWYRIEETLRAWPDTASAPTAAKPVCRFYHAGVNTHFFSANPADCNTVRNAGGWTDEGTPFYALLPTAGACGMGTEPVYRLYSPSWNTHRYTRSADTYQSFQANHDWRPEGVVFCSPVQ